MITETQSFGLDIRDAMYDVVTADAFWEGYTFRKNKMLQLQPELIPYLGVWFVDEQLAPDGDANAGCIRFNHTHRIGFQVIQKGIDPDPLEYNVDKAYLKIMTLLWTNAKLMNVLVNNNPEGVGIESAIKGTRRHVFGNTGLNNETPFVQLEFEIHCFSRSEWYPDITDTLDEIDVTTGIKTSETQAERDNRQQVTVKYMFDALRKAAIRS